MKKTLLIILFVINLFAENKNTIIVMTENYPPYNMKVDNKMKGLSVEILNAVYNKLGLKDNKNDLILTSWSRAYSMALKKKNHMVFSTTRTKERESLFKWVGPISKITIGLLALKSKKIKIKNIQDLNNYKIGAVLKDIGEQLLIQKGINKNKIQSVKGKKAIELSFKKMQNNRIDMFAYNFKVAKYDAKSKGFNLDDYEVVYILKEGELYFAFNKNTDDSIIKRWQNALDEIKEDGTFSKIVSMYK